MPGTSHAYRHVERHVQRHGQAHLRTHDLLQRLAFPRPDLEDELVMDLEQHPAAHTGVVERLFDIQHGHFDDVGRRALDRCVQRHPLGHLPTLPIVAHQIRQVAPTTEDGLGVFRTPRIGHQ